MNFVLVLLFLAVVVGLVGLLWAVGQALFSSWPGYLSTPAGRADKLLRQVLGTEEYRQLVRCGYLNVPSPGIAGRIYRIPHWAGRVEVIDQGQLTARLCVVPSSWVPAADLVLMHKLLI